MSQINEEEDKRVFTNTECPFYPCHTVPEGVTFNCTFCYCPLYTLGTKCGGNFTYSLRGIKSCMDCSIMHEGAAGYDRVSDHFKELADMAREENPPEVPAHLLR